MDCSARRLRSATGHYTKPPAAPPSGRPTAVIGSTLRTRPCDRGAQTLPSPRGPVRGPVRPSVIATLGDPQRDCRARQLQPPFRSRDHLVEDGTVVPATHSSSSRPRPIGRFRPGKAVKAGVHLITPQATRAPPPPSSLGSSA